MVDDGGAQVKALGARMADRFEGRRQHVLSRVLLHVVEPARPVDDALDQGTRLQRPVDHVRDSRILAVDHIEHRAVRPGRRGRSAVRLPVG